MNCIKLGFFVLIFVFAGAALPAPVHLTDIASAGSVGMAASDYMLVAMGDTVSDNGGCERCAIRDADRCPIDSGRCAVRTCERCPNISEYRCDLYGCNWIRGYGCPAC